MTKPRVINLGDESFVVPPLPIRWNREVYPICARLTDGGLLERWLASGGKHRLEDDEFADLVEIAWFLTRAAGATFDRAAFDNLPYNQIQLMNAFFVARYQTLVWLEIETPTEAQDEQPREKKSGELGGTAPPAKKRSRK